MQSQPDQSSTTAYGSLPLDTEVPPASMTAPRDWSLWLLPVACVMLAVGVFSVLNLPSNLDPLTPLLYWLWAPVALLGIVWFRTRAMLSSVSNNVITYRPNGQTLVWNWTDAIRFSLIGSLALAAVAAHLMWSGLTTRTYFDLTYILNFPFMCLIIAFILAFLTTLFWFFHIPVLQTLLHKRIVNQVFVPVVALLCIMLSSFFAIFLSPAVYASSFAPWSGVVQTAISAAAQIDPHAIVQEVRTSRSFIDNFDETSDIRTMALQFNFSFLRSDENDGSYIDVEVFDTNPPRIVSVSTGDSFVTDRSLLTSGGQAALAADFASVKLGPRDILASTENEAVAYNEGKPVAPSSYLYLHLGSTVQTKYGAPATWDVIYSLKPPTGYSSAQTLTYTIDGNTGRILAQEINKDAIFEP